MKVYVRPDGSCRRVGRVDGCLEQMVGFSGAIFRNDPSRLLKYLYKELFTWEWNGGQYSWEKGP